jgi:hypothetical protein
LSDPADNQTPPGVQVFDNLGLAFVAIEMMDLGSYLATYWLCVVNFIHANLHYCLFVAGPGLRYASQDRA